MTDTKTNPAPRKPCNIMIGVPSMNMVHAKFMNRMINLCIYLKSQPLPEPWYLDGFIFQNQRSSVLSQKREDLVENAIERGCTHLLFIDSDMDFPPDLAHRLLAHDKDCVAINCAVKAPLRPTFTAKNLDKNGAIQEVLTLPPGKNKTNLERVWRIGTGIMLVSTRACKRVKCPRFPVTWNTKSQGYTGEDWNFVDKLHKEARISTYIDHDLSWEVSHIGDFDYNPQFVVDRIIYEQWMEEELASQKKAAAGPTA